MIIMEKGIGKETITKHKRYGKTKSMIKQALNEGGGTFINGVLTPIDHGYSVGVGNINTIDLNILKGEENIVEMINSLTEDLTMYGLWVDDKTIYIDRIVIMDDLEEALELAKANKEKAIYDNVIKIDIEVKYPKGDE